MRKAMLGVAALLLGGCGMSAGHDARQLVKKDPATVAAAFAGAFEEGAMGGASQYSNLWHGGFQILIDKPSPDKLDVVTKFDGQTSTETHFVFTPQEGGTATLVVADVKVDPAVMHKAFAGGPKEELGNLPEPAFKQGMQKMMVKYAERIEAGMPVTNASEGWQTGPMTELPDEFYDGMPPDQREQIRHHDEEERQDSVSQPTLDPDAAARNYLGKH
jgi:hypothetical protein